MHLRANFKLYAAIFVCALAGLAAAGCHAEAQVSGNVETPPPPPPPPPPDQDSDGILDVDDKCAGEKEDGKAPAPSDGCPNDDEDGDGILTANDKCPADPETRNEYEDDDGCPDKKPLVQVVGTEVRINQKIQFKHDSAAIEAASAPVLDAVAQTLKDHAEIQLVEIGGHASTEGDPNHNKALTQKRVDSVVKALVARGIAKDRLVAQGYGSYCVLDPGTDEKAHEKNRRVEFKILQQNGKNTDVTRGCAAAEKAGLKLKALAAPKAAEKSQTAPEAKAAPKKPSRLGITTPATDVGAAPKP